MQWGQWIGVQGGLKHSGEELVRGLWWRHSGLAPDSDRCNKETDEFQSYGFGNQQSGGNIHYSKELRPRKEVWGGSTKGMNSARDMWSAGETL